MKKFLVIAILAGYFASSCTPGNRPIARNKDYAFVMKGDAVNVSVEKINQEISFWEQRLQQDTGSYVNMAELARYQLSLFKANGNVHHLHKGDSLLRRCTEKLNNTSPELLYSLSQNAVTQHQFLRSAAFISAAEKAQGDPYTIRLLQFDTYMELGRYSEAYTSLSSIRNKESFDYLIRQAKWEDHRGNLPAAVGLMEKALDKVKDRNKTLYCWTLSNLSDMYGHEGRVEEAYRGYLEVLQHEPSNLYCLKGIAWIAFSHDHNFDEAKKILNYILSRTNMPDLKLMLADIAALEGKPEEKKKLVEEFVNTVSQPAYGNMYTKYLVDIYTEEINEYTKALELSKNEISNRFTPETCSWLAWCYYKLGGYEKAAEVMDKFVSGKTFEPEVLYQMAFIYAAAGQPNKAKVLLHECLESSFELGPVKVKEIEAKLAAL
jgi:tetratricopeptide (TPR) repeat protein